MRKNRIYDPEFKKEAIKLARNSSKPKSHIAEDLGISSSTLFTWISKSQIDNKGEIVTDNEVTFLRKKLKETELERDILKKAMAIFSKQQ